MPLPTLLTKGNLEAVSPDETQAELDEYIPVEYIVKRMNRTFNVKGESIADKVFIIRSKTGSGSADIVDRVLGRIVLVSHDVADHAELSILLRYLVLEH